ncbi:hypothetical protein DACRYDRAFT_13954 [Dacryopinax primogenitus]|uniref:Uncharacterized protein n=1 Tax=Dacryopinax primogenitus (strain DJM 731) TaxID=1858805 RepID=M5G3K9_DACPD|nr:uncharacterized protein DACRYDRAFT_13954 [Dacryopinax primogenitus]EJU04816.1 hypothetical protein DACRYDRAFT_13954 [Dacryopinax primogenitus]
MARRWPFLSLSPSCSLHSHSHHSPSSLSHSSPSLSPQAQEGVILVKSGAPQDNLGKGPCETCWGRLHKQFFMPQLLVNNPPPEVLTDPSILSSSTTANSTCAGHRWWIAIPFSSKLIKDFKMVLIIPELIISTSDLISGVCMALVITILPWAFFAGHGRIRGSIVYAANALWMLIKIIWVLCSMEAMIKFVAGLLELFGKLQLFLEALGKSLEQLRIMQERMRALGEQGGVGGAGGVGQ